MCDLGKMVISLVPLIGWYLYQFIFVLPDP